MTPPQGLPHISTLVVDCLDPGPKPYPSHYSLPQTLELVRALRPAKTLLVGMSHRFEHGATNDHLATLHELVRGAAAGGGEGTARTLTPSPRSCLRPAPAGGA